MLVRRKVGKDRLSKFKRPPKREEPGDIKLGIYMLEQCSPKKCTARKLVRLKFAEGYRKLNQVPQGSVVLSPFAKKSISKEDLEDVEKRCLLVLDCSWEKVEDAFQLLRHRKVNERALPYLVPVNPVNFGRPFKLTTLEALASALIILGNRGQAERILEIYNWGPHFLSMNAEPLKEYEQASTSKEIIEKQSLFVGPED